MLASLGIYGVISYHVAQRTRELGIMLALGAGRRDLLVAVLLGAVGLAASYFPARRAACVDPMISLRAD